MTEVTLSDRQLHELARLIAAELSSEPTARSALVDAATVAEALGISRSLVYAKAGELGARRIGGPKGRLRFDVAEAREALERLPAKNGAPAQQPRSSRPRRRLTLQSRPRESTATTKEKA